MEHLTHTPNDGQRLDEIANHYYGDPANIKPILSANPWLHGHLTASAGRPIIIPIIDPSPAPVQQGLPPWR